MNILWLSHNVPYPPKGGVLQRNHNLLKEVSLRHNVYLVAFIQQSLLPTEGEILEAKDHLEKLCTRVEMLSIPFERPSFSWYCLVVRSLFTRSPYNVNWLKSVEMHSKIHELLKTVRFDLLHYDTVGLVEYFDDIATSKAFKVLNHHNIESVMMRRRYGKEKNIFKKLYFFAESSKLAKYERNFCPRFDLNIVVSEIDKQELHDLVSNTKIAVVPNGVDIDYFQPSGIEPIRNSIVFVGGMSWYPNRDAMLFFCTEVWPLLKKAIPTIRFTIVGKAPPETIVLLSKKDPSIEIAGYVPDVRPYLSKGSVFICPIRDGGGTRLKILDALAMGKAVVSTTIGCEGLDVTPGTDILLADTPQEWVIQIGRVFDDPPLRQQLEHAGRQLTERKYSWRTIGSSLNELYARTCNEEGDE